MKKLQIINLFIQLIIWILVCSLILYMIFFANSNYWQPILMFGLLIQLIGIIHIAIAGRLNKTWLLLVAIPLIMVTLIYIESENLIVSRIFDSMQMIIISIMVVIICYLLTIKQILKELKNSNSSS